MAPRLDEVLDWLYRVGRWTLGGIFIYAGGTKLLEPESFAVLVDAFGIIPKGLLVPMAFGLPILEVLGGIGLLFDIRGSLALITALLLLFMGVLGYGIWMGLDVDCGCFGPEDPEAEAFHGLRSSLLRDSVMVAGAMFLYAWRWCRAIRPVSVMATANQLFSSGGKEND